MTAKKRNSLDYGELSSSLIKKAAESLGFMSSQKKPQLVAELTAATDVAQRVNGLLAGVSNLARDVYMGFNNRGKVKLETIVTTLKVAQGKVTRAVAELEAVGLVSASTLAKSDKENQNGDSACFEFFPLAPLPQPMTPPERENSRFNVQSFLMDLVRLLQMVRQKAPRVLSDGSPGVRFLSKLNGVTLSLEGVEHETRELYLRLLYYLSLETGLTAIVGKDLVVAEKADEFFSTPLHVRVQDLFEGWLRNRGLSEFEFSPKVRLHGKSAPGLNDIPDPGRILVARRMITEALSAFGSNGDWVRISDFQSFSRTRTPDLLVKSVSEDEAAVANLVYRGVFTDTVSDSFDGIARAGNWLTVEGEFVRLSIWVLCVIGVASIDESGEAFRLTPEGQYCLGLSDEPLGHVVHAKCFVVQPNFEVVVYQERSTPEILHMLGSFSDLVSDQQSLVYRISLGSTYRAAESGLAYSEISDFLTEHSTEALPNNVSTTLKDWWERCDQVLFSPLVDVVELSDAEPYDKLPDSFRKHAARSGNYLIFHNAFTSAPSGLEVIDFHHRRKCLKISDDGTVALDRRKADIFLTDELRDICRTVKEQTNELQLRLDDEALKSRGREGSLRCLELLRQVSDSIPPCVVLRLLTLSEDLPCASTFNVVAVALPKRAVEMRLDEELLAASSIGRMNEYWLIPEPEYNKLKVRLENLGLRLSCTESVPASNGAVKGAPREAPRNGGNTDRMLTKDEILKVIERAIDNKLELELVYSLQAGDQRMVIFPTQIMASGGDQVIEAKDRLNGMTVMLTASNIACIRRVFRRTQRIVR